MLSIIIINELLKELYTIYDKKYQKPRSGRRIKVLCSGLVNVY